VKKAITGKKSTKTAVKSTKPAASRRDPSVRKERTDVGSSWIHRGSKSRRIGAGEKMPAGWKAGRGKTHGK
jgi:hypothetical protein